jgi:DHA1 family multidrug resistance protein-like MFS transporter
VIDWRRNLAALWFAQFTAIFGFSFAFPFLPLFLTDLGVHGTRDLAFWSGLAGGAAGLAQSIASPFWGLLADRYGRRSMLLRAMAGGGLTVALMGVSQSPIQLVFLRLLQGATSGTVAAATALVATNTPRERVGWALGVMSSAVASGAALGPLLGGLGAHFFGVRAIFLVGGVALLTSVVPVLIVVREAPVRREGGPPPAPAIATLRATGALKAIVVLIAAQGLIQISFSAFQPLLTIRFLQVAPANAATLTGLAFAVAGTATAASALSYTRLVPWLGYRGIAFVAAALLSGAEVVSGFSPTVTAIIVGAGLAGLFYGALGPATSSMMGLESRPDIQGRVFGAAASSTALGFGLGPLVGGGAGAVFSIQIGMTVAAGAALALSLLMGTFGREPSAPERG